MSSEILKIGNSQLKVDVDEGDLVEDVIVIVRVLRKGAPSGCSTVRYYSSPGLDRVTQIGMITMVEKSATKVVS